MSVRSGPRRPPGTARVLTSTPEAAPRWGGDVKVRPAIREAQPWLSKGTRKLRGTEVPRDSLEGVSQWEDAWEAHEDAAG